SGGRALSATPRKPTHTPPITGSPWQWPGCAPLIINSCTRRETDMGTNTNTAEKTRAGNWEAAMNDLIAHRRRVPERVPTRKPPPPERIHRGARARGAPARGGAEGVEK